MEVIKRFWVFILIIIGGSLFLYNYIVENIERKEIYTEVCQKVLNDNSESCLESPLTFSWSYSSDAAKKEISNYKQQVLEVEKLIEQHNKNLKPIQPNTYQFISASELTSRKIKFNKIVIGGKANCSYNFGEGGFISFYKETGYRYGKFHFCIKTEVWSEDAQNTIEKIYYIEITNIDEFPSAKKVYDLSEKLNFNLFSVNVFGEIPEEDISIFASSKIKADHISFTFTSEDGKLESLLASNIRRKIKREMVKFANEKYPGKVLSSTYFYND
jgi:hypothetical protein